jgi:hypothetical protein
MTTPCIEDYKQLCRILRRIPKRARARMKRKIKVFSLNTLDPTHQNRFESLRAYRRSWHEFAAKERQEKKNG